MFQGNSLFFNLVLWNEPRSFTLRYIPRQDLDKLSRLGSSWKSFCLSLPECGDYRHMPIYLAKYNSKYWQFDVLKQNILYTFLEFLRINSCHLSLSKKANRFVLCSGCLQYFMVWLKKLPVSTHLKNRDMFLLQKLW